MGDVELFDDRTNDHAAWPSKSYASDRPPQKRSYLALSAVEESEILVTWLDESFFIRHSKVNPTILTECAVAT
jgi:hypothetical protein